MDIYLEAILPNGEQADIGRYHSPVVPRINEKIMLRLHRIDGQTPYPRSVLFRVYEVRYGAFNQMKTEEWMYPYHNTIESESVAIEVRPDSQEAKEYLVRLAHKEQPDATPN